MKRRSCAKATTTCPCTRPVATRDAVAVGALPVHSPAARLMVDERVDLLVSTAVEERREAAGRRRDLVKRAVRGLVGGGRRLSGEVAFANTRLDDGGSVGHYKTPSVCLDDLPAGDLGAISIRARHFSHDVAPAGAQTLSRSANSTVSGHGISGDCPRSRSRTARRWILRGRCRSSCIAPDRSRSAWGSARRRSASRRPPRSPRRRAACRVSPPKA